MQTNKQTNERRLSAWILGPLAGLPGAPPCLCSCTPAQHLFHVGMSSCLKEEHTMALPTMPHLQAPTRGRRNNQPIRHCQPPSPAAPADNHQLLSRRSIVETTISRLCLSDSAPRLLLLLCIQSALDTSTSSLKTSVSEFLEKRGDQRGRSGAAEIRRKNKRERVTTRVNIW